MTLRSIAITLACALSACASTGKVVPFSLKECRGHLSQGEYEEAERRCDADLGQIEQSSALQQENSRHLMELASSAIRFGDYRIAERAAGLAAPYDPSGLAIMALAESRQGDYAAAIARGSDYLERFGAGAPGASDALEAVGLSLAILGRFDEARQIVDAANQAAAVQVDSSITVSAKTLESSVLWLAGDKRASGEVAAEALDLAIQAGLETSALLNNAARLKVDEAKYDEARALFEKSLAVAHLRIWPGHPEYASAMNDLGIVDLRTGQTDDAETRLLVALKVRRERLGAGHTAVAQTLNNLGALYHQLGDLDQAAALYEKALDINIAALGRSSGRTQLIFDNLELLGKDRRRAATAQREPKLDGP